MGRKPLVRIYDLYLNDLGRWVAASRAYRGTFQQVAARDIKQAYALANGDVWATAEGHPLGIVHRYDRTPSPWSSGEHRLWCGCEVPNVVPLHHGDGVTKIREFMTAHRCPKVRDER